MPLAMHLDPLITCQRFTNSTSSRGLATDKPEREEEVGEGRKMG
jgi:hypothetical protein